MASDPIVILRNLWTQDGSLWLNLGAQHQIYRPTPRHSVLDKIRLSSITITALLLFAGPALADSCEAIPDNGPMPYGLELGARFSGPVTEVIDGDSLCVATGEGPKKLVEVRLLDFSAPEYAEAGGHAAREALAHVALGKSATCEAGIRSYDRVLANCRVDGQGIGDLLRAAGAVEGGNGARNGRAPVGGYAVGSTPRRSGSETTSPSRSSGGYGLCAELRAKGGARRGEPGYRPEWDGDNDGIACEPYRSR